MMRDHNRHAGFLAELEGLLKRLLQTIEIIAMMRAVEAAMRLDAFHQSQHLPVGSGDRGRIVEAGATLAVLREPQHEYTRRLLAADLGSLD